MLHFAVESSEEDYAPLIHFLDPTGVPPFSPHVARVIIIDPDDAPTAQLIELLRPDVVFSHDRVLRPFGTVPAEWRRIAHAYRDLATRDAVVMGTVSIGSLIATFAAHSVRVLWNMGKRLGTKRSLVLVGGIVLVGLASMHPSISRRFMTGRDSIVGAMRDGAATGGVMLRTIAEGITRLEQRRIYAFEVMALVRRPFRPPRKALDHAAMVLARSPGPLGSDELVRRMLIAGYRPRGARPARYVTRVLRQYPLLFGRDMRYGWYLKSHPTARRMSWRAGVGFQARRRTRDRSKGIYVNGSCCAGVNIASWTRKEENVFQYSRGH